MKAKDLLAALELPLQIADRKISTSPIVNHVKFADGKAAAYNFVSACEIAMPGADLGCCVPAPRLAAALAAIGGLDKEAEVKLAMKDKRLHLTAPGVRYVIPTMPAADFPAPTWPADSKPIADWAQAASAMRFAVHACNVADQRHFCKGVGASTKGVDLPYIGGSDGHRGAIAIGESPFGKAELILPVEAVAAIAGLSEVQSYSASQNALAIEFSQGRYFVQLIDGGYVDLARVIPTQHSETAASVNRAVFVAATAAALKTKLSAFLRFSAEKNKIVIEDESTSDGGAHIEIGCTYDGKPWETGINIRYVADAAGVLDGEHLSLSFRERLLLMKGARESRSVAVMSAKL